MGDYHVTLFTSPWNKAECDQARQFLEEKGINFEEKSIQDPGAKGELAKKTGRTECPSIDVNGHLVVGFLPNKWNHLLSDEPLELT
ncbi:glutaredoxin [Desulfotomaculum nigrificans CO-1-SRB]|uniref:Glutaredoxin n=1 Tax=Desulfotomaculum nigrificans (strain DSM 14880 / VKM B-2319 / CO-1-SRB) TaxID=868595 RepID=F6B9B3_DESCC|nr:glutaredoxin domain-containing protein [Desulfotomaculum nigrificans]AEF93689.1 glutaredoxin [Desulfotomaculum nigrificans CO-1-SRB]